MGLSILEKLYRYLEVSDLKTLKKTKNHQKAQQEVKECVAPLKKILSENILRELFEKIENKARTYGRAAYEQGFHDAVRVLNS